MCYENVLSEEKSKSSVKQQEITTKPQMLEDGCYRRRAGRTKKMCRTTNRR